MNSEVPFFKTGCPTKVKEHRLPYYLPIAEERIIGFMPFLSRFTSRIAVGNHYITDTSIYHSSWILHHHHVVLVARISLTLSRHFSLSFIASGRSSGLHPVSPHSCWMYVRAGRPAFARPCVGVHKSTSLMSSSLLLQQCPACLNPQ